MIVILMGVTGAGKTTIGKLLARMTGWDFAEGDDYHSEANKQKMHAGIPLTDEDRAPWLATLHDVLAGWWRQGKSGILACSALKQSYRDTLVAGIPRSKYRFVLLEDSKEHIEQRLLARQGHYMNPGLLDSQFATLEQPKDALRVEVTENSEETAKRALRAIQSSEQAGSEPEAHDGP